MDTAGYDRPPIEVERLTKIYDSFTAVDSISFQVRAGEVFGFLGPNGAGKTTTIKMLCGIMPPTAGKGYVGGFDIDTQREKLKEHIGYMSQRFSLYPDLKASENLTFFSGIYGVKGKILSERLEWAYRMTGLKGKEDILTSDLPLGWKQRLALACALIHRPKILFLDEPTAGVDPESRQRFWDLIYHLQQEGMTIFITTHYMDEAERCQRLAFIDRGKIVAMGEPNLLKKEAIKGLVLELEASDPLKAMKILDEWPSIKEISLFGNALHLIVEDLEEGEKKIEESLKSQGMIIHSLRRILPSLEDAFFSLMTSEAKDKKADEC